MNKDVAAAIERALVGPYARVELVADGHALTVEARRVGKVAMTYGFVVFVDGWLRGENLKPESEIGAKFYPLRVRNFITAKQYDGYRKACGKRAADAFKKRCEYQFREPHFRTAKALVAHLKKTCKVVEVKQ